MNKLSHINKQGKAEMVDVAHKPDQIREAQAEGFIFLNEDTIKLIRENEIKKGDVLAVSEIAGIQSAKKCQELIPLCHNIFLSKIKVNAALEEKGARVESLVRCIGKTGVEMEALTAVSVAMLTIYDMCKAVDKNMIMSDIKLNSKTKKDM